MVSHYRMTFQSLSPLSTDYHPSQRHASHPRGTCNRNSHSAKVDMACAGNGYCFAPRLCFCLICHLGSRHVSGRMATIRRSRAVIDSRRRRDLVDDLELCRRTIVDRIAVEDAAEALDLMWQYMGLANPIQNRLHYTDETIAGAFSASDPV